MKSAPALLIAGIFAAAACARPDPEAGAKAQARRAADAYMKARGMERKIDPERRVTVETEGPHWVVTYHVPEGWAGGAAYVSVDKRTMEVVDFLGTQ